mgnify:CR=1 FL=1
MHGLCFCVAKNLLGRRIPLNRTAKTLGDTGELADRAATVPDGSRADGGLTRLHAIDKIRPMVIGLVDLNRIRTKAMLAQINWQGTSSQLLLEDLDWADLVLGMTQEHLDVAIELGAGLRQDYGPLYQLLAYQDELVDPLNCGLARYQELYDKLQVLLPKRLAAI